MHAHRCFWVIIPNKVKTDAHQGYDIWFIWNITQTRLVLMWTKHRTTDYFDTCIHYHDNEVWCSSLSFTHTYKIN